MFSLNMDEGKKRVSDQVRVWQIPFFNQIQIPNIIWFSEITEYSILSSIWYWEIQIPKTKYYLVLMKSKYRKGIVLLVLTIWISRTKCRIVYQILETIQLKSTYLSHTKHFVLKIGESIWRDILIRYSNTQILFGVPKKPNTEYRILFGIEKTRILNTNTTIRSNYLNSIEIPNICHTLGLMHTFLML